MAKELILEIGSEEIPAGFLDYAVEDLKSLAKKMLDENSLSYSDIEAFGTPRRLALRVTELSEQQEDRVEEAFGPPVKIAYDEKGNPTKPALGFAKAQGVDFKDLTTVTRDRGDFLAVKRNIKGQKTDKLLKEILPDLILSIPFRKSMKWGNGDQTYVRPLRWIVALLGGKTITFNIESLKSSSKSYGHRFMHPKGFKVSSWDDYQKGLQEGYVVLDQNKRREDIRRGTSELAEKIGGYIPQDDDLLETVSNLVEIPVVLKGDYEKDFLSLPKEVLISVMKNHQKYFPVFSKTNQDELLPHFIFVCGTPVKDSDVVSKGNERVIRARFTDARFFYDEDKSAPLWDKLEDLKGMVYLSGVGSYYDKTERLKIIANELGNMLGFENETRHIVRAAFLSKADLATQMVFEFPELQGIMGKYYAEISGETNEVAQAIKEHYMPTGRDGKLPESDYGAVLSIVDKIDNISSCFISGLIPTGTSDPYALRRQAIGIINILLEKNLHLSLNESFSIGLNAIAEQTEGKFSDKTNEALENIMNFMTERFRNIMTSEGYEQDVVEAVVSVEFDDVLDAKRKIEALTEFRKAADFEALGAAFKRVVNIVKDHAGQDILDEHFIETAEKNLHSSLNDVKGKVEDKIIEKNYLDSLILMKNLKEPVDNFFDNVMVMDKDPKIKENRLSMLAQIKNLFFKIADFSKLSV
ncbi:MAG: glycine--tRNA ligase subunit beta [Thermodesulfobacteriota bacterium]